MHRDLFHRQPAHWICTFSVADSGLTARVDTLSSSIANARVTQRLRPPWRGRMRVTPFRLSLSATRALVASLGQVQ